LIGVEVGRRQLFFRLQPSVAANVFYGDATLREHASDQQSAVASRRVLFRADHRHRVLAEAFFEARQSFLENARLGDLVVVDAALGIVVIVSARPAAQFAAEVDVLESSRL